jgi:DNA-binding transcriptional MocR family regulator
MKAASAEAEILVIPLDKTKAMPLYLQVERYITDRIMAGDFDEGMPMPSPRVIAKRNAIAKNTVLTAYDRMVSKGFLASEPSKWYYVCFPDLHREVIREQLRKRLLADSRPRWRHDLTRELPNPTPAERFRFGKRLPVDPSPTGVPGWLAEPVETSLWHLEEMLAHYINKQNGAAISADNLCIFGGQQHIFSQVAARLLMGKMVLVICPCDMAIKGILEEMGVLPVSINLQPGGEPLDVRQVRALCKALPVSAIVLDMHYYHMTVGMMEMETLGELQSVADELGVLLLEHASDRDLWFGEGAYPIFPAGRDLRGIHTSYLSNLLSPFCYFGLVAGPEAFISELKQSRHRISFLPDDGVTDLAGELIGKGSFRLQTGRLQRDYREFREEVFRLLDGKITPYATFHIPPSGLSCWLVLKDGFDVQAAVGHAGAAGIRLEPQAGHHFDSIEDRAILFGFATLAPHQLEKAISSLCLILEQSRC